MPNHKKGIPSFFAAIMLIFVAGCSANDSVKGDICKVDAPPERDLPKFVLVGTDVVGIKNFQSNKGRLDKSYSSEIGGATLTLSIISDSRNTNIKRTFQEPGETIHVSEYDSICISNGTLRAQNLSGKIVNEGILLLEKKPNIDGIPVDLWILYNKNN